MRKDIYIFIQDFQLSGLLGYKSIFPLLLSLGQSKILLFEIPLNAIGF